MYNLFIIGPSKSGKTPIANLVSKALGMPVISASDWARKTFKPSFEVVTPEDKQRYIQEITEYSTKILSSNPNVCVDYIKRHYPDVESHKGYILEGFRNPKDFLTLFNPKLDLVMVLDYPHNIFHGQRFETGGLRIITSAIEWFESCQLMKSEQYKWNLIKEISHESVEVLAHDVISWAGLWFQGCPV